MYRYIFMLYSLLVFYWYIDYTREKGLMAESISATYYNLKRKWIFSFAIASAAFPLIFVIQSWMMFVAGGLICGVVAAPAFRDRKLEETIHMFCAGVGYALGILAVILLGYWYIVLPGAVLCLALRKYTKNSTYWSEVVGYYIIWFALWFETSKNYPLTKIWDYVYN